MSFGGYRGYGGGYGLGALLDPQGAQINSANTIGQALNIENAERDQAVENDMNRYRTQQTQMQTALERQTYNDAMIAHAARTAAGDADAWDQNFRALDAQGVPGARQWIGRYSPAAEDQISRGYDPQSPTARASRPSSPLNSQAPNYDMMFAKTPGDQIPAIADRTGRAMDLLAGVKDSATWEAAKAQAAKLGIPTQNLGSYNPIKVQAIYDHLLDLHDYLSQRTMDQSLGVPAPLVSSGKPMSIGDTLYSVDTETPTGEATATPIAHAAQSQFIGVDRATGRPIYHDVHPIPGTPSDTMGPYAVQPKGSVGAQTYDRKMQAWLSIHPGDNEGALAYANNQKQLSPQEINETSLKMAQADLHSAIGAGETIADPGQYVEQRAAQYRSDLSAAPAPALNQRNAPRYDQTASLAAARAALKRGAPRASVLARLKQAGISPAGL